MRHAIRWLSIACRLAAGGVAISRLMKAATVAPPVRPTMRPARSISVVIPARDEAARIAPVLAAIVGAPGVGEVIVVDDQSSDDTAQVASSAGATVITGRPLPAELAGKAWALQQGIEAASGDWIVTLDADTRPDPRLAQAVVSRAIGERYHLLTLGGRFDCPTAGARWLHAAMLTTLVYRSGPPGVDVRPERTMANGQCMAFERQSFLAGGGMEPVRGEVVEDIALARHVAMHGKRVGFLDGSELLEVRMFETAGDTWRGWGRSLALPGAESRQRQLAGLAVVACAQALPLVRVVLRRADAVDAILLALRMGTLAGTRSAYSKIDWAYWLSPLADVPATIALAQGISRRGAQTWRGRTYG